MCASVRAAIEHAERFIYIENQFFVTTAANEPTNGGEQTLVLNRIGNALYRRIKRAHATGQRFRVVVVLPLVPAFTGMHTPYTCHTHALRPSALADAVRHRTL